LTDGLKIRQSNAFNIGAKTKRNTKHIVDEEKSLPEFVYTFITLVSEHYQEDVDQWLPDLGSNQGPAD
jgi:hypothetical protein